MNNFEILKIDDEKYNILVVMKTYEAPFLYLMELATVLKKLEYIGVVLIDELIHSGNNNDRFIKGYFDGDNFDKNSFSIELIDRRNDIRKYSCGLLRNNPDIIDYSTLNKTQKILINKGAYI